MDERLIDETALRREIAARGIDIMSDEASTVDIAIRFGILPPDVVSVEDLSAQVPASEV